MATTASGCVIETVNGSNRNAAEAPYLARAYICMMMEGIETLTAVTAILSPSLRSSIERRWSARVFRDGGSGGRAAMPFAPRLVLLRSDGVRKAGGPAEMKCAEPESNASFI